MPNKKAFYHRKSIRNMKNRTVPIGEIGLKAGIIISISLIVYFMIMRNYNLTESATAWTFNLVLLFIGIAFTFAYYRLQIKSNIDYFQGIQLGGTTTTVCAIIYTAFIYAYVSSLDPLLLQILKDNPLFIGRPITPFKIAATTLIEGICSGVILSFIVMQLYYSGFQRTLNDTSARI